MTLLVRQSRVISTEMAQCVCLCGGVVCLANRNVFFISSLGELIWARIQRGFPYSAGTVPGEERDARESEQKRTIDSLLANEPKTALVKFRCARE